MLARSRPFACALFLALVIALLATPRAPRAGTWMHDPTVNTPVVAAPLGQCVGAMVPDGKDGAMIAVAEPCTLITSLPAHFPEETMRLYHLRRGDGIDPAWAPGGVTLPFTTNFGLSMLPDGFGGAFVAWSDTRNLATTGRDAYLLRVDANGAPSAGWPSTGLVVCNAPGAQFLPHLCSDGFGGVFMAWSDRRDSVTNGTDVYTAHVKSNSTIDPAFGVNGKAMYAGAFNQSVYTILPDATHGAYVLWSERRNGAGNHVDIYAQHVLFTGQLDVAWPVGGLGVAATTADENYDASLSDGAGGYYVAWEDFFTLGVGVVHFLPSGTLDPAWPAGGPVLTTSGLFAYAITLLPDGAGGLLAVWNESPDGNGDTNYMYARHILANGTLDPTWGPSPRPFAPTPNFMALFDQGTSLPDPAGGGLLAWTDTRPGAPGLYALRVRGDLTPASGWNPKGVAIATAPRSQAEPAFVSSGASGAVFAFSDLRDSLVDNFDVYAQRLSERGRLGVDEPLVASVRDVAADQGGQALVRWYWSSYDTLPTDPVSEYAVWRQLNGASLTAQQRAAAVPAATLKDPQPGALRVTSDGATDAFWEFVGSAPARGTSSYALAVPTLADSTSAGTAFETYEVDAHVSPANEVFSSPPDSGYSVDNLAPATPTGFAGAYASGTSTMRWNPVIAPDLAGYRLYRGLSTTFTPSPANRVTTTTPTTTNYTDPAGASYFYKLTAIDVHGNESAAAVLLPSGVTAVGDSVGVVLAFGRPAPDPAVDGTRFTYALPHAGHVRLALYDLAGRLVRRLSDGVETAGPHAREWDLRGDDGARVRAGMYFARFETSGARFERRVIVTR